MRLLITTDTVGGVWTFTSELTQQLLGRGHAVHLVSFGRQPSAAQQSWADTHSLCARHPERSEGSLSFASGTYASSGSRPLQPSFTYTASNIPLEWMQYNERAFEDGQELLLQQAQAFDPDLILSNQFCFGHLHTPTPRIVVAHSDVLSWAAACRPSALEPTPWLNRYTSIVQAGLLAASTVIAPTAWMGSALKANFSLPGSYLVIPNGTNVASEGEPVPLRKLQAITAGRLWDEAKGLDTLQDLNSPIPLLVAGDNTFGAADQPAAWPAHLRNLGSLGQRELHHHFRESAIYLCASRYEPFGLAPLEAALCGCAIVARDLPSLREVWGDGALYFTSTSSLHQLLQSLTASPDSLAQAQRRAHFRATQYTAERMTDSYLHLFQTVLQQQQVTQHVA